MVSSIDLENIAIAHPAIAEAAVVGVRHPKWDERPIVVAVKKPGQDVSKAICLKFYEGKVAKWWMPDDVVFVDELPPPPPATLQARAAPAAEGIQAPGISGRARRNARQGGPGENLRASRAERRRFWVRGGLPRATRRMPCSSACSRPRERPALDRASLRRSRGPAIDGFLRRHRHQLVAASEGSGAGRAAGAAGVAMPVGVVALAPQIPFPS